MTVSRRQFVQGASVTGLGLLAGCGRLPGQAPARVYRLGYLSNASPTNDASSLDAFRRGLREHGYLEAQNLTIEYRSMEGQEERLRGLADELVRLQVELIVARGTLAVQAAKAATSRIPIVFPIAADPVGDGLVASLARPGGNVTGFSALAVPLSGKRLELLKETVPGIARVAWLWNSEVGAG